MKSHFLFGQKRRAAAEAAICLTAGMMMAPAWAEETSAPVALFDGKSLEGWTVVHSSGENFQVENGVLRVKGPKGWLRSAKEYGDFVLRVEFRFLTEDADSGVFVRAAAPAEKAFFNGWPANSYQVQTREMSKNQSTTPIWLGDIFRHPGTAPGKTEFNGEALQKAVKKMGEWQEYEIEVMGSTLTVKLNGVQITRAENLSNPRGYIGLQGESDLVEYRKIEIEER